MTQVLFHQLNEELKRIADDAVSPNLINDLKPEIKQAFYIAQAELIKDILHRDLIEYLVIGEPEHEA